MSTMPTTHEGTSIISDESVSDKNTSSSDNSIYDSPINRVQHRATKIVISDSDEESESDDDVIAASSDEEPSVMAPKKQITLPQILQRCITPLKPKINLTQHSTAVNDDIKKVSKIEFDEQQKKVNTLRSDLSTAQNLLRTINLSALQDGGKALQNRLSTLKEKLVLEEETFKKMIIDEGLNRPKLASWDNIKAMSENVQPKTFGKQAMATLNAQKAMTLESLEQLHSSLTTCPAPDVFVEDPKGLRVELMPHQKHALAWLLWRESQKPSGGILADDMGLGKTLTMISLVLKSKHIGETEDEDSDNENRPNRVIKPRGGTLVVCPASLLKQWESEVEKHCKRYTLSVELFHGYKRETKAKRLAERDLVITTYTICTKEHERQKNSALYGVRWRRIILDEAHQIRNHKTQTSVAICEISGQSRWALTGTPVHNKELDMYSLLKFLRCTPFDDYAIWKRWIANKNDGGQDRIQTVISSIMLRRTKAELQQKGALEKLPEKSISVINISLEPDEQAVYQKILIFSRTLFAQYLHQRAEKESDLISFSGYSKLANDVNGPYFQMHKKLLKLNKIKEVKSHEILVLLLRLRQMCCHPSLIVNMLHGDQLLADEDIAGHEEFNILEEMRKLNIDDKTNEEDSDSAAGGAVGSFHTPLEDLLNPENPIFSVDRKSTKMKAVLKLLKETILPTKDKVIIVSQWTTLLRLLGTFLKEDNIPFEQLDGTIAVAKRMIGVDNFNNPKHHTKILLLSLTAGGVGLNLVGANHMIVLDLHWNPQLEMQAHDRIYRVGQNKQVHIYKFVAVNTIEEKIKALQEQKLALAESILTGAKIQNSKLSLHDLRLLFNM
ncbi:putative DNA binding protein [Trypoxylus dichotomus]